MFRLWQVDHWWWDMPKKQKLSRYSDDQRSSSHATPEADDDSEVCPSATITLLVGYVGDTALLSSTTGNETL